MARSPDTVNLLSLSSEDATFTKKGFACLFPVTTVTSPRSELEAEDELKEELQPVERPLAPSHRPPRPPPELRPLPRLPRPKFGRIPELLPPPGVPPLPPPFPRGGGGSRHPHRYHCHHHGRRHPRGRHPRDGSSSDRGCRGWPQHGGLGLVMGQPQGCDQIEGCCGPQLTLPRAVVHFGPRLSYRQELRRMHRRTPD